MNGSQGTQRTDVMVKLKQDQLPLSRAAEFFKNMDQGSLVAIHVQREQDGQQLEDPIVKVFRAPARPAAGKDFYEAMIPVAPGDVVLTAYFQDNGLVYLTGNEYLAEMVTSPIHLTQLATSLAGIHNVSKSQKSQRVFFAGHMASESVAQGGDLISLVGNNTGDWMQITHFDEPGIVIAELFRDNNGGQLLAYRTDSRGRRIELVMASLVDIELDSQLLSMPQDKCWRVLGGVPKSFKGSFVWAGRFKRTAPSGYNRVAMMGLTGGKIVRITISTDEGSIQYGKIADSELIPVTTFRFGSADPQIALQQHDNTGTRVTVGAASDQTPAYQRIIDAISA